MKKLSTLFLLFFFACTMLLLIRCKYNKDEKTYSNAELSDDSLCLVKPSWFPHDQTPAPEEGVGSPFDTSSTTNQIFHQWSWNKFLWLTKPGTGGNPLFLDQSKVLQVTSQMEMITIPAGASVVLQDIHQAGSASGVLTTNPNYSGGKSDTIFYSIHMNATMYRFADSIAKAGIPDTNDITFPVGSFEMKVAWAPITAIPAAKQSQYFTTTASLSKDSGKTYMNTKVALVGMHIIGVVQNHPEFIWATFEHNDIAPNYDWKAKSASSTSEMLLFKAGSTTGIDGITYVKNSGPKQPFQAFDLFQLGVPRDSTGGFMSTSEKGEPVNNFDHIAGINKCVQSQLKDVWNNYFYNGSLWLNMDGTTPQQQARILDSLAFRLGNATPGSFLRGSTNCANVTMETYTQTFQKNINQISVSNLANCFSCHSSVSFQKPYTATSPLYLSHIFQAYLLRKKGTTAEKVETMKTDIENVVQSRIQKQ